METELITNDGVVLTSVGVDHEDSIGHDTNEIIQRQSVLNQQQQRQRLGTELTLPQKVKLIQKASRQQTSNSKLARQFGISPATVGRILKRKEEYLNLAKGDFSGGRKRKFRVDANVLLNQKVLHWIESLQTQDMLITNQMIRNKALQIAKELEINKFKASNGWLESFRQRHQIRVARASSKAHGNVPGAVDIAMNNNVNLGLRFEEECSHTDDHVSFFMFYNY
jgi:IS30 family transposase